MSNYFSEGMTEDDEVFGDATRVAAEVLNDMRNREGTTRTFLGLLAGFPLSTAIEWDPTKPKTNKWLGKRFTDVTRRPDSEKYGETTWRDNLKRSGGSWQTALSPRYHHNPAYMQNGVPTEPPSGFPKVFRQLDSGAYGYGWPTSVEEHPRFRGTIPGTDIPWGPSKPKSDQDRPEINAAYQEKKRWLLQMIQFWEGKNPIKAANYRTELENLSEDDF